MNETLLEVKGMTCSSCVRHVQSALDDIEGVSQVEIRLRDGRVLVKHDPTLTAATLVEAIVASGYEARPTL